MAEPSTTADGGGERFDLFSALAWIDRKAYAPLPLEDKAAFRFLRKLVGAALIETASEAALAAQSPASGGVAAEPVAWAYECYSSSFNTAPSDRWQTAVDLRKPEERLFRRNIRPLYEHPPVAAEPVAGWKLVPVEPDLAMIRAARGKAREIVGGGLNAVAFEECWEAALAAAPTPPAGGGETERSAVWSDPASPEAIAEVRASILALCNSVIGDAYLGSDREVDLADEVKAKLLNAPVAPSPASPADELAKLSEGATPGLSVIHEGQPDDHSDDMGGGFTFCLGKARRTGGGRVIHRFGYAEEIWKDFDAEDWAEAEANIKLISALWNAYRSGRLVEAAPADRGETRAVGGGWKLVPVEPTRAMQEAGGYACQENCDMTFRAARLAYAAMLAAAPTPDQNRGEPDQGGEAL